MNSICSFVKIVDHVLKVMNLGMTKISFVDSLSWLAMIN